MYHLGVQFNFVDGDKRSPRFQGKFQSTLSVRPSVRPSDNDENIMRTKQSRSPTLTKRTRPAERITKLNDSTD